MNQKSPFKFLDAYNEQDHDIFFGRDQETEALYDALSGVKHLLVYGPSGAGKTSLIECGLRNQFSDADWYALTIRRGADLNQSVLAAIRESLDDASELPDDTPFGKAIERLFAERFQPVYLLFDQFEELLISAESDEKKTFFKNLNDLIQYKVPCRVLLIMREEFVGHLSEYEKECPSIFQHRFRLEKMGRANVRAVILKTLKADQYHDDFSVAKPDVLTEKILSKLPDNQRVIELTYVQVFLNELWERARENEVRKLPLIDVNLVDKDDKLEKILDSFLKKQILDLERSYPDNLPLEILVAMISERGTKLQLSKGEIETDLKRKQIDISFSLLELLVEFKERRVIRSIKSNDKIKYEISHDVLAALIKRNKTKAMIMRDEANTVYSVYRRRKDSLLSQSDIDYLRPYRKHMEYPINLKWRIEESLSDIKKQEELALKIARRRIFSRGIISVVVISAFLGFAYWSDNLVDQKTTIIKLSETLERLQANVRKIKKDSIILDEKDNKYGFADRNGNVMINHEYDEATTFDYAGYAKVKKVKDTDSQLYKSYLLDKTGKRYRVEYSIYDARNFEGDEIFTALDLRGRGWKKIPIEIFNYGQLEVLLLGSNLESTYPSKNQIAYILPEIKNLKSLKILDLKGNLLKYLPEEVGELTNLEHLDLSYNKLDSLPPNIGQLNSLKELNLSNTNLSKVEKQKINKLLPNCKIKF